MQAYWPNAGLHISKSIRSTCMQIGGMPFRLVLHENNHYTSLFHSINCPFDECVYYHLNDAAWLHFAKIIQVRDEALIPTQDQILWKLFWRILVMLHLN